MIYAGYVKVAPGKPHVKPRTGRVKLRKFSLGKGKKSFVTEVCFVTS